MVVKSVTLNDLHVIEELNKKQPWFKLETINNCIIDKIAYSGNIPIAYGIVKRMAEAIILVNSDAPKISRAKAMRELMQYAEMGARREHCEQLHCFVKDENLAKSLEKQFGFQRQNQIIMVKDL